METKPQLKSKINWVAIVMVLTSLGTYLAGYDWSEIVGPDTEKLIVGFMGILIYVFRTYFTDTSLKGIIK